MTGLQWSETLGKRGRVGGGCLGFWDGRGIPEGVGGGLYGGRPGGATLWGVDVGPHSEDLEGPGQLSVQGREEAHWEADAAE